MTAQDFERFAGLMLILGEYYGREVSRAMIALYFQVLARFSFQAIEQAVLFHLQNPDGGRFFPKVADLVRRIEGSAEDKALSAWAKVDQALCTVGPYASVDFGDPLIHRVIVEMGGWIALGKKSENDWPFVAREFIARYRSYAGRDLVPNAPAYLPGIVELENRQRGFPPPRPERVGLEQNARAFPQPTPPLPKTISCVLINEKYDI